MSDPVSSIRNLGPASDAAFARVGIHTADDLRDLGADAAYARLLAGGSKPHFIGYYALVMGLQGRPWNDCRGAEKDALRARFDQIKASALPDTGNAGPTDAGFERILDRIGIVTPNR
ncbi:MAG TPA: competence protein TfoX [Aliiroseovarius sp.]|nr:competence protein TfoX [Aliiroseovarius sp.]